MPTVQSGREKIELPFISDAGPIGLHSSPPRKETYRVLRPFLHGGGDRARPALSAAGRNQSRGGRGDRRRRPRPWRGLSSRPRHSPRGSRGHRRRAPGRGFSIDASLGLYALLHAGALLPLRERKAHPALHRGDHRRGRRARSIRVQGPQSPRLGPRRPAAAPGGHRGRGGPAFGPRRRPPRVLLGFDPRQAPLHSP